MPNIGDNVMIQEKTRAFKFPNVFPSNAGRYDENDPGTFNPPINAKIIGYVVELTGNDIKTSVYKKSGQKYGLVYPGQQIAQFQFMPSSYRLADQNGGKRGRKGTRKNKKSRKGTRRSH